MYLGRFRDSVDPISKIECDWSSTSSSFAGDPRGNHAKIFWRCARRGKNSISQVKDFG